MPVTAVTSESSTDHVHDPLDQPAGMSVTMASVGLIVLCLLVYGRTLTGTFHYDDLHAIVANDHIHSLASIPTFFTDPGTFSSLSFGGMFRPLVMSSYALTYAVVDLQPTAYLATNLAVHVLVTLVVAALLRGLGLGMVVSTGATVLFAIHPVNVETVAYISSRSESMCTLFVLVSLWLHGRRATSAQILAVVSFAAALLTKSVGVMALPLILLHDVWLRGSDWSRATRRLLPYAVVTAAYLPLVARLVSVAVLEAPVRSLATQGLTQVKALVYYGGLIIVPRGLSVEHQFDEGSLSSTAVWTCLLLLLSALVILWRTISSTSQRYWWLWIPLGLLPTIVIPLNVLVNEHRLYLPSIGVAVLVATCVTGLSYRRRYLCGGALVLMAVLAWERGAVWQDSSLLWADALRKAPAMPRPYLFSGDAAVAAGNPEQALDLYAQALQVNPARLSFGDRLVLHNNRGAVLLAQGDFNGAFEAYGEALRIDTSYTPAREAIAALLALRHTDGQKEQATALQRAGLAALVSGDLESAVQHLRASVALSNELSTWLALAMAYERREEFEAAAVVYRMLALGADGRAANTARGRLQELKTRNIHGGGAR